MKLLFIFMTGLGIGLLSAIISHLWKKEGEKDRDYTLADVGGYILECMKRR